MVHKKNQVKFPVEQAWAAVSYADRVNEGQFVNDSTYFEPGQVVKESNKKLAYRALENLELITEEDRTAGVNLAEHFQGLLFKAMNGRQQNGFMETVTKIVGMKEVGRFEVACMAALPKTRVREIARAEKEDRQFKLAPTSAYIGNVGEKVQTNIEILDSVYSRNYNIFIYTATDNKNIIKFTSTKDNNTFEVGSKLAVKGTVKRHSVNDKTGIYETWLTRVKLA